MEHKEHHRREIAFLVSFLVMFFIIFAIALIDIRRGIPVFGIGIPYMAENITVLAISMIAMVKVLWHIVVY
ncbi:hypothetical protein KY358_00640 [Candidatus Woesearchaeota archaeon]|nr:hypothetical protein [Candidatus Woesearchaeota archaeon]